MKLLLCIVMAGVWISVTTGQADLPVKKVAILQDGASYYFDAMEELVKSELRTLTAGEFQMEFVESSENVVDWDVQEAEKALERALSDPTVDLVYASGLLVSRAAMERKEPLPKPVISGFIEGSDTMVLPLNKDDTSTISNYTFVIENSSAEADVMSFRRLVPFTKLYVTVDEILLKHVPRIREIATEAAGRQGLTIELIPMGKKAADTLAALPADAQAVYLTPPEIMGRKEYLKLIEGINERKIPSYSMMGHDDVTLGALAGQASKSGTRIARRIALNIQSILLGASPNSIKVFLDTETRLLINGRTAALLGIALPYEALLGAQVIHQEAMDAGAPLTLDQALELALENNYRLAQSDAEVSKAEQDRANARGTLFPQATANLQYAQVDEDRAKASMGSQPEKTTSGGFGISQVIFNDPAITAFRAQSEAYRSSAFERDTTRLDVLQETANAYINLLSGQAMLLIDARNFELIRQYLDLATIRQKTGVAGPEEVYRWETQLTGAKSSMLSSYSQVRQAMVQLNQAMGVELGKKWVPRELGEADDANPFWKNDLASRVSDDRVFDSFMKHLLEAAEERAPELRALDFAIRAQQLMLNQYKRSFVLPEVGISGTLDHYMDKTWAEGGEPQPGSVTSDRDDWMVGVSAKWYLFEGGSKLADVRKAEAEIERLAALREQSLLYVRQRVYNAMFSAASSHPNIELTDQAAEWARKNLKVIQEKYARGVVSILDLLDAQNEVFVREQKAALAKYTFFNDIASLERSISWFPECAAPAEREAWDKGIEKCLGAAK